MLESRPITWPRYVKGVCKNAYYNDKTLFLVNFQDHTMHMIMTCDDIDR